MTVAYPYRYHPVDGEFSGAWHAEYSASNPLYIAATCAPATTFSPLRSGYSTDGGYTWTQFPTLPLNSTNAVGTFGIGSVHVGSPGNIIWVSSGKKGTYRTTDHGATWTAMTIPGVTISDLNTQAYFFYRRPIAFEKTASVADTCYAHAPTYGFYKSTDAGATWTQQCTTAAFTGTNWTQNAYLKAVPGHPGHLFNTPGYQGTPANPAMNLPFIRSTDGGVTWTQVPTIRSVRGFDFGAAAPAATYPTIYVVGVVAGVAGVYSSIDNAATWSLLSAQPAGYLNMLKEVAASKDTYGLHWISTGGRALIRGALT